MAKKIKRVVISKEYFDLLNAAAMSFARLVDKADAYGGIFDNGGAMIVPKDFEVNVQLEKRFEKLKDTQVFDYEEPEESKS
jgi:hypothetical protein